MSRLHHRQTAQLCQALASPPRLHLLNLLAQCPWTVGELASETGGSIASVSAHLKPLRTSGLIESEKVGREVFCQVKAPEVFELLSTASRVAETLDPSLREAGRIADEDPYLYRETDMDRLIRDVRDAQIHLLDFRTEREFHHGHVPGAQSLPFTQLSKNFIARFDPQRPAVGYCRGPWCAKALESVETLNDFGLPTQRLRLGVVEWRASVGNLTSGDSSPDPSLS